MAKKSLFYMLFFSGLILFGFLIMQPLQILHFGNYIDFLFPKGWVAVEQRDMLFVIQILMLIVVIPVFVLTFIFSWRYRAGNKDAKYDPNFVDNYFAEIVWWGFPLIMTIMVSVFTWVKTHELDPYKPLVSDKKEINIQVVALQWRWLFIYPEEKIAVMNFLQIPKDHPVRFDITADAPMNSFWIPKLGGQIYAMPSMKTVLNLIANEVGDFRGSSANISGVGFSKMHFITRASSEEDYQKWVTEAQKSTKPLDFSIFNKELVPPSENSTVEIYQLKDTGLFDQIVNKYMHPQPKEK